LELVVNPADTESGDSSALHVAFGWGDRTFYVRTRTWDNLSPGVAFNALFCSGSAAMHVTFYSRLEESESCRKIRISRSSYLKLVQYVRASFSLDGLSKPRQIAGAHYWSNDSFYEAEGTFSLFFTCNTWANSGLKAAGMEACLWTPFYHGIFRKYADHNRERTPSVQGS
jgi:uncharacterized protein (TIGR02117 family)